MSSILAYKVAVLVLLAVAGGSSGTVWYYYQGKTNDLTGQVSNLNNQTNSQDGQINSLKDQVDSLTRQVNNLTSQIGQLETTNKDLVDQITLLRQQLSNGGPLCSSGKTLIIGELLDLSGPVSTTGKGARDSTSIAISDVNSFLSTAGCSLRFSSTVYDYGLDSSRALTGLQSMAAAGVQVVVGPLNSGAAQYVLAYANANHIVLISPSSTSPTLSIPNDYLFRTSPTDPGQAAADARMLVDRGAKAVIIVQRHDAYGDGLASAIAARFTTLGGVVANTIQYDPSITDFTSVITSLNSDYQSANAAYPNQVAIDAVSFEEFAQLINQTNSQHPSLLAGPLPWFGTDGEAQDYLIIQNPIGSLVTQVRLPSTVYSITNNSKTINLLSRLTDSYPGQPCDVYCLGAYDDVWLAALATVQVGSYDGAKIQSIMLTVASNYFGVTGWTQLDSSGDRVPAIYQIWKVALRGSTSYPYPTWVLAGTWDATTDSISWTNPP